MAETMSEEVAACKELDAILEKVESTGEEAAKLELTKNFLHATCALGNVAAARKLLEWGADPRLHKDHGWTALHSAAAKGQVACCKLLLEYGADINATNDFNETALSTACDRDQEAAVAFLLEAGADPVAGEPLHTACSEGYFSTCKRLLDAGADPNRSNINHQHGTRPIQYACADGHPDIVLLLFAAGAFVDPAEPNFPPGSFFHGGGGFSLDEALVGSLSYPPLDDDDEIDDDTEPFLRRLLAHSSDVACLAPIPPNRRALRWALSSPAVARWLEERLAGGAVDTVSIAPHPAASAAASAAAAAANPSEVRASRLSLLCDDAWERRKHLVTWYFGERKRRYQPQPQPSSA